MNLAHYRCSVKQHRQPLIIMTANLAEVRIILETTSGHTCVCLHCGAGNTAVQNAGDPSGSSDNSPVITKHGLRRNPVPVDEWVNEA